jgi:hypothetical protein
MMAGEQQSSRAHVPPQAEPFQQGIPDSTKSFLHQKLTQRQR